MELTERLQLNLRNFSFDIIRCRISFSFVFVFDHFSFDVACCHLQQLISATQRRSSRSALRPLKPLWPDSDSDTEDFINVISESRKALIFTKSALEQFHRDHEEGSIVRDPAEYVCISNCLQYTESRAFFMPLNKIGQWQRNQMEWEYK